MWSSCPEKALLWRLEQIKNQELFTCIDDPLMNDTTMFSSLTRSGEPRPQGRQPGSPALRAARQAKERTYPELVGGARCRLVVLAMEVGGKWRKEAADFLRLLAQPRNRSVVPALRKAAVQASIARWSAMLTMAARAPFAGSLILQNPASHTTPEHPARTPPRSPTPGITPRSLTLRGAPRLWIYSRPTPTTYTNLLSDNQDQDGPSAEMLAEKGAWEKKTKQPSTSFSWDAVYDPEQDETVSKNEALTKRNFISMELSSGKISNVYDEDL